MGITVPRPQMRALERRTIELRLRTYDDALKAGKSREEAMRMAQSITARTVRNAERRAARASD